jgi:hypothetical protein
MPALISLKISVLRGRVTKNGIINSCLVCNQLPILCSGLQGRVLELPGFLGLMRGLPYQIERAIGLEGMTATKC